MPLPENHRAYWRRCQRLIVALLAIWFVVTFVAAWFARDLRFEFFGWPFGFWVAAQGALLVYVALIGAYAWVMGRLDRLHGVDEQGA